VFYKLVTSAQAAGATAVLAATGTTATTGRFAVNDFVIPTTSLGDRWHLQHRCGGDHD
jgi:hypothetical protein